MDKFSDLQQKLNQAERAIKTSEEQAKSALKDKQTIIDSLTLENVKFRDEAQRTEIAENELKTSKSRIKELDRQKVANNFEKVVLHAEQNATTELKKFTDETAKAKEKLLATITELNEKVVSAHQKSQEKQEVIDILKEKISQI